MSQSILIVFLKYVRAVCIVQDVQDIPCFVEHCVVVMKQANRGIKERSGSLERQLRLSAPVIHHRPNR